MDYLFAPEQVSGDGFVIRSYREGDGEALREAVVSSYDHLAPTMPWASKEQTVEETERMVRKFRANYLLATDFCLAFFNEDESELLGGGGFHLREGPLVDRAAEIGMWIGAKHAGKGLGTRILVRQLEWAFAEWPFERLAWRCNSDNLASKRTAEKAGMTFEGILRCQAHFIPGERRDTLCFSALKAEWNPPS